MKAKRILSLVLSFLLVMSSFGITAFADTEATVEAVESADIPEGFELVNTVESDGEIWEYYVYAGAEAQAETTATVSAYKQVSEPADAEVDGKYYELINSNVGGSGALESAVSAINGSGATGGLILISEGTLVVSNRQDITMDNIVIKGAGETLTTITGDSTAFNNTTNGLASSSLSSEYKALIGNGKNNVKIMDMTIDGGNCGSKTILTYADFKPVRINGNATGTSVTYLENLTIKGSYTRSNLVVGMSSTYATVYAKDLTVEKPGSFFYGSTEIVSGSTLEFLDDCYIDGMIIGSVDGLGKGYYKLEASTGVTVYTTIPKAIEICNDGGADLINQYCTNDDVAEGATVAEEMVNDLTTIINGEATLLYGKNCEEMKALATEFKAALDNIKDSVSVDTTSLYEKLNSALAISSWHTADADGNCANCGAEGVVTEEPVPSVKVEGNVDVDVEIQPVVGVENSYTITLKEGNTWSDGTSVKMTFPAVEGSNDGDMAYVVHEHEGVNYIYVGEVKDGSITITNSVGFSTFTVNAGGLNDALEAASDGDTIELCADVDSIPTINKPITIKGNGEGIEVNCAIAENFPNIDGTVTFENLTFNERISTENASSDQSKMTLKFVDCTFNVPAGNTYAIQGGASWNNDVLGALVVENCTFNSSASSLTKGYMVYAQCVENVTVTESTFDGNDVFRGAIHLGDSTEYATVATVSNNTIKNIARGVQVGNRVEGSELTITGNTFENVAAIDGETESATVYIHEVADAETTDVVYTNNEVGNSLVIFSENNTGAVTDFVTTFTGNTANETAIELEGNYSDTVYVPAAGPVEVASFDELKAAIANGGQIKLTANITTTAAIVTSGVTATIDLNDNTLTIGAGDNKFNDASNITIKNGNINITGVTVKGNAIFCLDEYEETLVTTLTLDNVNLTGNGYSSAYGIFYIGDSSVLNVNGGEWNLTNDTCEAGGVFKADDAKATLNIDGLDLTAHNVRRVVTWADTTIANSTMTITGDADGVDAEMEHGFNRSPLTITSSAITMENLVGRGITAEGGAVAISESSTVTITNAQEATIDVRGGQTVTVDSTSAVTVDAEPTVTSGTISGDVTVKTAPKGTITSCLVNLSDSAEIFISSEITDLNATESVVIKLYSGETQIATTTLQKPEYYVMNTLGVKIIITGESSSWKTEWAEGMPRADYVPDKVVLYVDGQEMSSANVPMISTDGEAAVNWAEVPGVNPAPATIGTKGYNTVAEAFAAAVNGDEVVINVAGKYSVPTNKDITITGAVEGVVFECGGSNINMNGASVTFNNVTFNWAANGWPYHGLAHCGTMEYNNCIFNGTVFLYGTSETFNECVFNVKGDTYNVWTYGAKAVEFNKCTFNSDGKSVLVYNEGACATDLTVVDTDFIAFQTVDGKAAIEIDTSLMPSGTEIVVDAETSATGFSENTRSGSSLWHDKKVNNTMINGGTTSIVIVAGVTVKDSVENGPQGELQIAYTSVNYSNNIPAIFGEAINVVAKESFVVKLYSGETLVGTAALVDDNKMLLNGEKRTITWHAALTDDGDSWWSTTWESGALNVNALPDTAKLYVDEVLVSTCNVELNINDLEKPVIAAKVDDSGNVQSFFAGTGYINGTGENAPVYDAALKNALEAGGNVVMLRDVTLNGDIKVTGANVTLDGDSHIISGAGGMWFENGTYDIKNVKFENITVTNKNYYGVLEFVDAKANVTGSAFNNNTAPSCIAVDANAGEDGTSEVTIDGCSFTGNTCSTAVINSADGTTIVKNSTITNNTAGIAVIYNSTDITVTGNKFSGNTLNGDNANKAVVLTGPWAAGDYTVSITENAFLDNGVAVYVEDWSDDGAVSKNDLSGNYWLDGDEPVADTDYVAQDPAAITMNGYYTEYDDGILGGYTEIKEAYVAQIGETTYATLEEAFEAASEGDTITILDDTTLTEVITVNTAVTLDLNGHTITNNVVNDRLFRIYSDFTIDGTDEGSAIVSGTAGTYGVIRIEADCAVTLNGGSYTGSTTGASGAKGGIIKPIANSANGADLTLNNVTVETNNWIIDSPAYLGSLTITGGTYATNGVGITAVLNQNSKATLTNVTVTSGSGPAVELSGYSTSTATLTNCTLNAGPDTVNSYGTGGTALCVVSGIAVTVESGIYTGATYAAGITTSGKTLNIKGGTFNGAIASHNSEGTVTIEGGDFTNFAVNTNGSNGKVEISGGTFDKNVSDYCADGFTCEQNADGTYTAVAVNYVASINDTKYETLAAAVEAANDGETITLLANAENETVISKEIIINLSGHTANVVAGEGYKLAKNDYQIVVVADGKLVTIPAFIRNIATTNANGEDRYQVVFLAGIDSLNYSEVGFKVTVAGVTKEISTTIVYTGYTAAEIDYAPEAFGEDSEYIIGQAVNFSTSLKDEKVEFKPYAKTLNGEYVYGITKTINAIYNK